MFDIHQSVFDQEAGEMDRDAAVDYTQGLMEEFAAAPEAQPIIAQFGSVHYAGMMMRYCFDYLGPTVPQMTLRDFNEVVFTLIPRQVSTPAESAEAIITELRAFWIFIHRQYGLANASQIGATLNAAATQRLRQELADPRNFGQAKSFFVAGEQAGFDMTTKAGVDAFALAFNNSLLDRQQGVMPPSGIGRPLPVSYDFGSNSMSSRDREEKRKAKKAQRQQRKRNRK